MLLAGALGSRVVDSLHRVDDAIRLVESSSIIYTVYTVHYQTPQGSSQQQQVLETTCSNLQSGTPEDGHSGARNMLS